MAISKDRFREAVMSFTLRKFYLNFILNIF